MMKASNSSPLTTYKTDNYEIFKQNISQIPAGLVVKTAVISIKILSHKGCFETIIQGRLSPLVFEEDEVVLEALKNQFERADLSSEYKQADLTETRGILDLPLNHPTLQKLIVETRRMAQQEHLDVQAQVRTIDGLFQGALSKVDLKTFKIIKHLITVIYVQKDNLDQPKLRAIYQKQLS